MKNIKNKLFGITILSAAVMLVFSFSTCEAEYPEDDDIPVCQHEWGGLEIIVGSNCATKGRGVKRCIKCNHNDSQELPINLNDHKWETYDETYPTCTMTSLRFQSCTRLGCTVKPKATREIVVPSLGHDREIERSVWPTCTTEGKGTEYCVRIGCDAPDLGEKVLPALGHDRYINRVLEPTCTDPGEGSESCIREGCTEPDIQTVILPAKGHDFRHISRVIEVADCTTPGKLVMSCSHSGCDATEIVITESLGHDWTFIGIGWTCSRWGCIAFISVFNPY
jgi:hypothetical protein